MQALQAGNDVVETRRDLMLDGAPQYSATWHSYFNRIADGSYQ